MTPIWPDALEHAFQRLVAISKAVGSVTFSEINKATRSQDFTSEQIEALLAALNEANVRAVDAESDVGR